jgi:hypothetical protein
MTEGVIMTAALFPRIEAQNGLPAFYVGADRIVTEHREEGDGVAPGYYLLMDDGGMPLFAGHTADGYGMTFYPSIQEAYAQHG